MLIHNLITARDNPIELPIQPVVRTLVIEPDCNADATERAIVIYDRKTGVTGTDTDARVTRRSISNVSAPFTLRDGCIAAVIRLSG